MTPSADHLAEVLARRLGTPVAVERLQRMSGGASRETWSFDAIGPGGCERLVLRRDPGGHSGQSARASEYELLRAARAGGVPVPTVRFLLEPDDALGSGFVMDRIDGETIPRRILRDDQYAGARPDLATQCGSIAARIHAVDVDALPALDVLGPSEQVAQYREYLDGFGEPHPAIELGLRWLEERAPSTPARPRLVHGDFRNGNFVVGPEGIRAVLDWELAHLGDPVEDLGWLCVRSWRFGVDDRVVGGFGSVGELLAAYAAAGGVNVTREELRYWQVFGTLKWAVICEVQCFTHLHGMVRSVELAVLGRRVAEMEWDLLELIS